MMSDRPDHAEFEFHPIQSKFRIIVHQYGEVWVSPWTGSMHIAVVEVKDPKIVFENKIPGFHLARPRRTQTYIGVSQYYDGDLPTEQVILITPIDTVIKPQIKDADSA